MSTRIVLADDEAMIRAGLRMLLEAQPGLAVVGEAADGLEAVEVAARTRPDVVLMDIRMPRLDGIEAARRIIAARPETRVLMVTTFDEDEHVAAAVRAGVNGFLLKVSPPEQLLDAVRAVAAGNGLLDPAVTMRVIRSLAAAPQPDAARAARLAALTDRETDVLRLVARGLSNAEIAAALFLGEATVKTYLSRMLTKLDLRDRVQAVAFAYESGLVRPGTGGPI
ncbi:response regulator [Spirilliplanes yamanashiensis]|uniref:DNA-binding response regulator n=1 Tax=Spirilliplanes yamanashiensis TaxID=42233 RepID=A0A8J3YAM0_9ACTN|nr:response regulator transcription factor [Spirilliplanes yamanashiensis]MDP9817680.1 DNA-binding NarL/FixJ family response regulator [Spirilliplanes yamanashiensis]GIJ04490.1 DNA-binding response regulator [Spirilliplanes yamanashiensis]